MKVIGSHEQNTPHIILQPLCFSQSMTTTAQTACALCCGGAACKQDNGKFQVSYLCRLPTLPYASKCTHLRLVGLRLEGNLYLLISI